MRISLVLLLCVFVVVVNSATTKLTTRRVVSTTKRGTTQTTVRKSAYAYLRSVRGKNSCAGGSCPFWERHGRSFAALRCYSQQYQECTCLHRMCFSSCMFSRQVCNDEMVSCLRQICPRCIPTSATAMCAVYDAMAVQVANALSVFACYPCCPNLSNTTTAGSTTRIPPLTLTITLPQNNPPITAPVSTTTVLPGQLTNGPGTNVASTNGPNTGGNVVFPGNQGPNGPFPSNAGNTGANINGNAGANTNGNANGGNSATNNNNNNNIPVRSQRVQSTVRPTTRRVVTTRRTSATTRRAGQGATTARGNPVKIGAAKPVQNQKKPQTNNGIKS